MGITEIQFTKIYIFLVIFLHFHFIFLFSVLYMELLA